MNTKILAKKYIQDRYKLNKNQFIQVYEEYVNKLTDNQKRLINNNSLFWYAGTNQKDLILANNIMCKNIIILGF